MIGFNGLTEGTPPLLVRSTYKLNKQTLILYLPILYNVESNVC
ncbi:Uncharacterised protein [Streptococcus pneumoniae]|nr:Uncharacterised protein [Streptococcus pneumoniae]